MCCHHIKRSEIQSLHKMFLSCKQAIEIENGVTDGTLLTLYHDTESESSDGHDCPPKFAAAVHAMEPVHAFLESCRSTDYHSLYAQLNSSRYCSNVWTRKRRLSLLSQTLNNISTLLHSRKKAVLLNPPRAFVYFQWS